MHIRKCLVAGALASPLWILAATAAVPQTAQTAERLDTLLSELADPDRSDAARIEAEVQRLWAQSGSPAMDLLFRRAQEAMEAEDAGTAIEHLTALIDMDPGFAEAFNLRATAFFVAGEYGLSLADIERTLALNPRHFGALEGLGAIMEELDHPDLALRALRAAQEINPHRENIEEALSRLERQSGTTDL